MKYIYTLFIILLSAFYATSQNSVLPAYSSGSGCEYSFGEVFSYGNSDLTTVGYIQGEIASNSSIETIDKASNWIVAPNPVNTTFSIIAPEDISE